MLETEPVMCAQYRHCKVGHSQPTHAIYCRVGSQLPKDAGNPMGFLQGSSKSMLQKRSPLERKVCECASIDACVWDGVSGFRRCDG